VQVFGRCIDKQTSECSLVMELMHKDLNDHIDAFMKSTSGASFELPVALDIMLQIADAMLYLHKKEIVHRDLKARNILTNHVKITEMVNSGYMQSKVADLCESKVKLSSATNFEQTVIGMSQWVALELFEEKSSDEMRYTFKANTYSYAITCSEILMGKLPFADIEKCCEMKEAVKKGMRPALPDSLPVSMMSLIKRCWDADPSMRSSSHGYALN
jgi:serine/threonine protein kinase